MEVGLGLQKNDFMRGRANMGAVFKDLHPGNHNSKASIYVNESGIRDLRRPVACSVC